MQNNRENQPNINENQCPSFFKSSCTGIGCSETSETAENNEFENTYEDGPKKEEQTKKRRQGGKGGFTCCVPNCFNNSKRNRDLSFYAFPTGSSAEKIELRKCWLHLISRKDFKPTLGHRVCSEHFEGGRKTYLNNLPTITPKTEKKMKPKPRPTVRARNRDILSPVDLNTDRAAGCTDDGVSECFMAGDGEALNNSEYDTNENLTRPDQENELGAQVRALLEENAKLKAENAQRSLEVNNLLRRVGNIDFSFERYKNDDKMFKFYTGLPNYRMFKILFHSFGSAVEQLIYHSSNTNVEKLQKQEHIKRGRKRTLSPEQEFFLVLVRLRLGLLEEDLAQRASISQQHLSRIWITWLDFLHSRLRSFPIWPSRACIDETMPKCFKETYPSTRVIIDCTEIYIEKASSVRSQSATYSQYKHHNTAKALIGITPAGAVSFASDLYAGRTSDKQATVDCGIIDLLERNDSVMADKGFDIGNDLPEGVSLNIPPFLRDKEHLSIDEEIETRKIASVRINVERAISRIKTFRILSTVFPITMSAELNKISVICAYLTNFLPPLINDKD